MKWSSCRGSCVFVMQQGLRSVLPTVLILLSSGFLFVRASVAQTESASVSGTIVDRQGGLVPDVQVTIVNTDTNEKYVTKTNQAGVYTVPTLKPGHYHIVVTKAGFKQVDLREITLTRERIKHYSPKNLYIGPGVMGTWSAPASKYVLQAAASYVDVLATTVDPQNIQTQVDYTATSFGDKPMYIVNGALATSDSALWRYNDVGNSPRGTFNTQAERTQNYSSSIEAFLTTSNTVYSSRPIVGFRWWDYLDEWNEGNWGVVDLQDNAYDGMQDCQASGTDAWGHSTGGEEVVPSWQSGTAYAVPSRVPSSGVKGNRIQAVASNGKRYEYIATVGGTSGSNAPTWPTLEGAAVTDGSVTWMNIGVKPSPTCYGNFIGPATTTNQLWQSLP
jgi:hypothetical protein